MSAKQILEKLETPTDRAATTVYLSKHLVSEVRKESRGVSLSKIIEELLAQFLKEQKRQSK